MAARRLTKSLDPRYDVRIETMMTSGAREHAGHRLLQLGTTLFLLGLLTGLAIPALANPRMALASHLEGLLNGIFLLVLGLIWTKLNLSPRMLSITFWFAVYSTFANWGATLLAAMWPAGSALMPMAAHGHAGTPGQEAILKALLISLSLVMIALCVLMLIGLRRGAPAASADRERASESRG